MSWSLKLGSIAGTAVRIHITFILFLAWIFGASYVSGGPNAAWSSLLFMMLLFLCVLAHEFGHLLTARAFGVLTPDVILLPIGGVARLERIPEKPLEEFLIAIAGPLVNVVIASGLVLATSATLDGGSLAAVESAKVSMADRLASVNLFLAIFNLIPAFPMDGGRILRAFLSARLGFVRATEIAAMIGQWVAFALGFIGLFGSPMLIFIAIFVYLAASSEAHMVALRSLSQGVPVGARDPREGRDIVALPDLRLSLHAGRRAQAPAGKGRARSRRARWCGPAGRARELRNARRNADDRGRHAAWIPPGQRPPARSSLKGSALSDPVWRHGF